MIIPAATASLTLWNARALCLFFKLKSGNVDDLTTAWLSPKRYDGPLTGTPNILNTYLNSIIKSVAILADTNSDP